MVPKSQEMCLSINTKYKHIFNTLFFTLCETKHSTFNVKVPITEYPSVTEFISQLWPDLFRNAVYIILLNIWTICMNKNYICRFGFQVTNWSRVTCQLSSTRVK